MTTEQFKNNWQPQMIGDYYARFSFNLDLKELEKQIYLDGSTNALEELYQYLFDKLYENEIDDSQIMYEIKLYIDKLKEQNK